MQLSGKSCRNRMTIIGSRSAITKLTSTDDWATIMTARHITWLELFPKRHVCEFSTTTPALIQLQKLSLRWLTLVFLLDYEFRRSKGLVKAVRGSLENCEIRY